MFFGAASYTVVIFVAESASLATLVKFKAKMIEILFLASVAVFI